MRQQVATTEGNQVVQVECMAAGAAQATAAVATEAQRVAYLAHRSGLVELRLAHTEGLEAKRVGQADQQVAQAEATEGMASAVGTSEALAWQAAPVLAGRVGVEAQQAAAVGQVATVVAAAAHMAAVVVAAAAQA